MWFLIIWQLSLVSDNVVNPPRHTTLLLHSPKSRGSHLQAHSQLKQGAGSAYLTPGSEPGNLWLVCFTASGSPRSPFCSFAYNV